MKKEILEREAATDGLAAAPADGETDGVASYSPPSSNRGGYRNRRPNGISRIL